MRKEAEIQYVKKLFETNKGNFSGSKPIIGRRITFNPEEIGAFGLEQFFYILYNRSFEVDHAVAGPNKKHAIIKNVRF